jgi:tripartite-type tricarboxylate transporter receptor subunit TctC
MLIETGISSFSSKIKKTPSWGALALATVVLFCTMGSLHAQEAAWPAKSVRFVTNFPPGGPLDILARSFSEHIQAVSKQSVIVENRAGAGGNLGADVVAKSAPDGTTVLFTIDTTMTVNPYLYKTLPFKVSDLKPVMVVSSSGLLVGVNPATNFKTLKDLSAAMKTRKLNFSSGGNGSPGHLAVEVLMDVMSGTVTHVPYKGNAPAVSAILSGEVDGGILATPGMLPFVKAGKITPLAVTSRQRSKLAPELPTVAEAGLKDLEMEVLYLVMVPAATPDSVVSQMQKLMHDTITRNEFQQRVAMADMHVEALTGEAAVKRLQLQSERYAKVVKATNMKVD